MKRINISNIYINEQIECCNVVTQYANVVFIHIFHFKKYERYEFVEISEFQKKWKDSGVEKMMEYPLFSALAGEKERVNCRLFD